MAGAFISDKRVVRDGVLIAFKGQAMTQQEAEALGLTAKKAGEDSKSPKRGKKEAAAEAEALGIKVPSRATIAEIDELIAAKRAELEAEANSTPPENEPDGAQAPESGDEGAGEGEDQTDPENEPDGQTEEDGEDE